MRIEAYFKHLSKTINGCPVVQIYTITFDKRGTHEGFVHGEIYFVDDTTLHLREYIDVEFSMERLMYVYHYLDSSKRLIFRYDNTGHHKKLNLPTYPHHKHEGCEENVIAAPMPGLVSILNEIEEMIHLP